MNDRTHEGGLCLLLVNDRKRACPTLVTIFFREIILSGIIFVMKYIFNNLNFIFCNIFYNFLQIVFPPFY